MKNETLSVVKFEKKPRVLRMSSGIEIARFVTIHSI